MLPLHRDSKDLSMPSGVLGLCTHLVATVELSTEYGHATTDVYLVGIENRDEIAICAKKSCAGYEAPIIFIDTRKQARGGIL